jgi:hypothetical protein
MTSRFKPKSDSLLARKLKVKVGPISDNGPSELEIEQHLQRYEEVLAGNLRAATAMYEATKNVAAAWLAFSIAFSNGLKIPDSVRAEIERFAGKIESLASAAVFADPGDKLPEIKPAEVARLWRGTGGSNPFAALQREYRDYRVFLAIRDRIDQRGMKLIDAIEAVRSEGVISTLDHEALKKIWKRYQKTHRNRPAADAS